jgi:hypothetical protein
MEFDLQSHRLNRVPTASLTGPAACPASSPNIARFAAGSGRGGTIAFRFLADRPANAAKGGQFDALKGKSAFSYLNCCLTTPVTSWLLRAARMYGAEPAWRAAPQRQLPSVRVAGQKISFQFILSPWRRNT